jgi:hypothetical protein
MILCIIIAINVLLVGISLMVSFSILKLTLLNIDSLFGITIVAVIASILLFAVTGIIYFLSKDKYKFTSFFEANYMFNLYIWGILTILSLFKPEMVKENLLSKSELEFLSNYASAVAAFLFFLNLTNYTLFTNIVIEKKLKWLFKNNIG